MDQVASACIVRDDCIISWKWAELVHISNCYYHAWINTIGSCDILISLWEDEINP